MSLGLLNSHSLGLVCVTDKDFGIAEETDNSEDKKN